MKKFLMGLFILVMIVSFIGCATIVVKAPAGKNIQFASGATPENFDQSKQVWYVLWGLVPLGDNSTADMLASVPNGSKVFVKTEMTFIDGLISYLLSIATIQTRTVSIAVIK